jgi:hypothetical protein
VNSPTFLKPNGTETFGFSFADHMLDDIEHLFTKESNESAEGTQVQSHVSHPKMVPLSRISDTIGGVSNMVIQVRLMLDSIKVNLRGYEEYLQSQQSKWFELLNKTILQY